MKRILLYVFLAFIPSSMSFAQTNELAISQITNLLNSSGTTVRGASYDGSRIVFESQIDYVGTNSDLNNEIFVYDLPSRKILQITDTKSIIDPADSTKILLRVRNTTPMISGDGTAIVFTSNATLTASNNDDGNYEVYLATLPTGATAATFLRITNTGTNTSDEVVKEIFTNYSPDVSGDGRIVAFLSTRRLFLALDNGAAQFSASLEGPNRDQVQDGNAEMFLYNVSTKTYTQVTISRDVDAMVGFEVRGFNGVPHLSGNGQVLAFISGFNYPGTNSGNNPDFNGEIFVYRQGDPANSFRQLTNTTETPAVPFGGSMNLLQAFLRPLNSAGTLLVFESAGDFAGTNADKTRELFLADLSGAQPKFTQITNQATADILKSDFNFLPSINGAGTFITFGSVLNLVPTQTHSIATDNEDGSRDLFIYDIAGSTPTVPKFRQLTFTRVPEFLLDPRQAANFSFSDNTGTLITFDYVAFMLADNLSFVTEIFQERLLPITMTNSQVATIANAASFDAAQIARGSIAAVFGTMLSNSIATASTATLPEEIDGVRLTIGTLAAKLIFVSPGQINFIVPQGISEGAEVAFSINNNGVQSTGKVKIVSAAPGVFSITGDGTGEASAQCGALVDVVMGDTTTQEFVISEQPCNVGTEARAAYLILYGTGWRFQGGTTLVTIGGETLTPVFAGAQPSFPGLDQINLALTQTLKGKGTVDVIVNAGTVASKTVTVRIQ